MKKMIIFLLLITGIGYLYAHDFIKAYSDDKMAKGERTKGKKEKLLPRAERNMLSPEITVVRRWELPEVLREVSGIAYMGKDRFACVQDEVGSVYVYNTASSKIEREIPFGPAGDYEGITVAGKAAYIIRSDGMLYEVADLTARKPAVSSYKTPLTATQNIEGLCFDKNGSRLLLAVKDEEPGNLRYKGIYEFSLSNKTMKAQPVYKIDLDHELSLVDNGKKIKLVRPSEIGRRPDNSDLLILDGPNAGLLVMSEHGDLTARYNLGKQQFAKPEGITFSPEGNIYISNEGKKQPANITEISMNR